MAPAADDEFGLREQRARGRRKAVDPVLADPDHGEPCASPLMEPPRETPSPARSRRHDGSKRAWRAASPTTPASTPLLSLAGATAHPAPAPIPQRIGGFGGAAGLADFLRAEKIGAVVDATHPFAARMSMNAAEACRRPRRR